MGIHVSRASLFIFVLSGLVGVGQVALAQALTPEQIINGLQRDTTRRGIRLGDHPVAPQQATPRPERQVPRYAMTAPTAPRQVAGSQPPGADGPSINITINFPSGSAELTPSARQALQPLCVALPSPTLAGEKFRIEGHTDNTGNPDDNMTLSQHRAETVVTFLTGCQVGGERLQAVGKGQTEPLISHTAPTDDLRNRRVKVVNISS